MARRERSTMVNVRLPRPLEEFVDAYAEAHDQSFSEAMRALLVKGIESTGAQSRVTGLDGQERVDESWKRPS